MLVASERNLSKGTRYEVTKREGRYGVSYVWTVERHVGGEVFALWREGWCIDPIQAIRMAVAVSAMAAKGLTGPVTAEAVAS